MNTMLQGEPSSSSMPGPGFKPKKLENVPAQEILQSFSEHRQDSGRYGRNEQEEGKESNFEDQGWAFNQLEHRKRQEQQWQSKLQQQNELKQFLQSQAMTNPRRAGRYGRTNDPFQPTPSRTLEPSLALHPNPSNLQFSTFKPTQTLIAPQGQPQVPLLEGKTQATTLPIDNANGVNQGVTPDVRARCSATHSHQSLKESPCSDAIPFPALPSFMNTKPPTSGRRARIQSSGGTILQQRQQQQQQEPQHQLSLPSLTKTPPHVTTAAGNYFHGKSHDFQSDTQRMTRYEPTTMASTMQVHPAYQNIVSTQTQKFDGNDGQSFGHSNANPARDQFSSSLITPSMTMPASNPSLPALPPYMTYYSPSMATPFPQPPPPMHLMQQPLPPQPHPAYAPGYPAYPYPYPYPYPPVMPPNLAPPPNFPVLQPIYYPPSAPAPPPNAAAPATQYSAPTPASTVTPAPVAAGAPFALAHEPSKVSGKPSSDEPEAKKKEYQHALEQQILEKKQREEKLKQQLEKEDMKKTEEMKQYHPFGRAGAGAPLLAPDGSIINTRSKKQVAQLSPAAVVTTLPVASHWEDAQNQQKHKRELQLQDILKEQIQLKEQQKMEEKRKEMLKEFEEMERMKHEQELLKLRFEEEEKLKLHASKVVGNSQEAVSKPAPPKAVAEDIQKEELLRKKAEEEALKRKHKLRKTPVSCNPSESEEVAEVKQTYVPPPRPPAPPSPVIPTLRGKNVPPPELPATPSPTPARPLTAPRPPPSAHPIVSDPAPTSPKTSTADVLDRLNALKKVLEAEQKKIAVDLQHRQPTSPDIVQQWTSPITKTESSVNQGPMALLDPSPSPRPGSGVSSIQLEVLERVNAARMRKLQIT